MCPEWNSGIRSMATQLSNTITTNELDEPNNEEEEDSTSDEAPSTGHVINMYQCTRIAQKTTTEKELPSDGLARRKTTDIT